MSGKPTRGGHFKDVPYFNGGIFVVEPVGLNSDEIKLLVEAASEN